MTLAGNSPVSIASFVVIAQNRSDVLVPKAPSCGKDHVEAVTHVSPGLPTCSQ